MNGRFLKSALGGTGKHVLEMLTQVRKQVVGEKEQNRKTTILLLTSEEGTAFPVKKKTGCKNKS